MYYCILHNPTANSKGLCYAFHNLVVLAIIPNWTIESTKEERLVPTVAHTRKELKV